MNNNNNPQINAAVRLQMQREARLLQQQQKERLLQQQQKQSLVVPVNATAGADQLCKQFFPNKVTLIRNYCTN